MAYKMIEWTDPTGRWMVAANESAKTAKGKWWYPARMMKISLIEYVDLLREYGADDIHYYPPLEDGIGGDVLCFSFAKYADAHKFLLYINRLARKGAW